MPEVIEVVQQIDKISELKGLGVMLYYGDTSNSPSKDSKEESKRAAEDTIMDDDSDLSEQRHVNNLLHHCIMGLTAIQHNGNMVIRMHEMHDMVTMGLLLTLYNLF